MLSYAEINEIVKTLPTGIYLGTRIEFELSQTSENSYYDPMKFKIVLSYPTIAKMTSADTAEEDIRCLLYHETSHAMLTPKDLYDFLGNSYYLRYSKTYQRLDADAQLKADIDAGKYKNVNNVNSLLEKLVSPVYGNSNVILPCVNIFEDQRIETLNEGVFLKVNFPAFIKKLNNYQSGEPIKDFIGFFYHVVRYNDIEPDLVKELYNLIYSSKDVFPDCDYGTKSRLAAGFFDLIFACMQKWELFNAQQQQQNQQQNQQQQQDGGQSQDDGQQNDQSMGKTTSSKKDNPSSDKSDKDNLGDSDDDSKNDSNGSDDGSNDSDGSMDVQGNEDTQETSNQDKSGGQAGNYSTMSKEETEQIIKDALKEAGYDADDIETAIENLADDIRKTTIKNTINKFNCTPTFSCRAEGYILRMLRKKSIEAKSINGYSGRLNPKNVHRLGRVEDYRWFDKANPNGLNTSSGKFRINFFCDNSGSFSPSREIANSIIRTLWMLSKKHAAFEFTLITHGDSHVIRDDSNMAIECNEGTEIHIDLQRIFHDLQKRGQQVWNFVLFDGGIYTDTYSRYEYYKFWNHNNVIMICDNDDKEQIERYCPKAKKIFTRDYCAMLEENILSCMDQMFR